MGYNHAFAFPTQIIGNAKNGFCDLVICKAATEISFVH